MSEQYEQKLQKEINELKSRGVRPKGSWYSEISVHAKEAILVAVQLLKDPNPSVRLGAVNTILDRVIPKVKSIEIKAEQGEKNWVEGMFGYPRNEHEVELLLQLLNLHYDSVQNKRMKAEAQSISEEKEK